MAYEPGSELQLYVTNVDGEGHYLKVTGQVDKKIGILIESTIQASSEPMERGLGAVQPQHLQPGLVCVAKYNDGAFYRARVTNLSGLARGTVGVHFMDYGNSEEVPVSCVRLSTCLPDFLREVPPLAADFLLARVVHPLGAWDEHMLEQLRAYVRYKELACVVEARAGERHLAKMLINGGDLADSLTAEKFGIKVTLEKQQEMLESLMGRGVQKYVTPGAREQQGPGAPVVQQARAKPGYTIPVPRPLNRFSEPPPALPPAPAPAPVPTTRPPITYKSRFLELHSQHRVHVSYAREGPELFAIQLQSDESALTALVKELNALPPMPPSAPPMPGSACLGRFPEDRTLCRAVVMGVTPQHCKLFFVDFGLTEMVSFYDIYDIPEEFVGPSVFALRFSLSGSKDLPPGEHTKRDFHELVTDRVLTLKVVPPEGPPLIQYGVLELGGRPVRDLLLERAALRHHSPAGIRPLPPQALLGDPPVLVSFVDSCTKFFVQPVSNSAGLDALMEQVHVHCEKAPPLPLVRAAPGLPCCALFPDDKQWYRATVTGVKKDKVTVYYVDYGNEQEVSWELLRPAPPELLQAPAHAAPCALLGFQDEPFNPAASDAFEQLVLEKTLVVHTSGEAVAPGGATLVRLTDPVLGDIAQHLRNNATKVKEDKAALSQPVEVAEERQERGGDRHAQQDNRRNYKTSKAPSEDSKSPPYKEEHSRKERQRAPPGPSPPKGPAKPKAGRPSNGTKKQQRDFAEEKRERRDNWKERDGEERRGGRERRGGDEGWGGREKKEGFDGRKERREGFDVGREKRENFDGKRDRREGFDGGRERSEGFDGGRERREGFDGGRERREGFDGGRERREGFDGGRENRGGREKREGFDGYQKKESWGQRGEERQPKEEKQLEDPLPLSSPLAAPALQVGEERSVVVTWFSSPQDLFLQLTENMQEFRTLMGEAPSLYRGVRPLSSPLAVGDTVLARFSQDKALYRARVLRPSPDLMVTYVDYGNSCKVGEKDVWQLSSRLASLPVMGVRCSLQGAPALPSPVPPAALALLRRPSYSCRFLQETADGWLVALKAEDVPDVAEALRACLAPPAPTDTVDLHLLAGQIISCCVTAIASATRFTAQLHLQPAHVPDGESQGGGLECCCELQGGELPKEGSVVRLKVTQLTQDKVLLVVCEGEGLGGLPPLAVSSPRLSSCFITHTESLSSIFLQRTDTDHLIARLLDSLYNTYSTQESAEIIEAPKLGDLCAAKSADDNWYRAEVIQLLEDGSCAVRFLDYGDCSTVNCGELRVLKAEFLHLPRLALCVALAGVTKAESAEALEAFKEAVADRDLTAELTRSDSGWTARLLTEGEDIGAKIMAQFPELTGREQCNVFISHVDGPGQFWMQLESGKDAVEALQETLQIAAANAEDVSQREVGQECVAKYTADDLYYRAIILDADGDITTVRFIDYGNTDVLDNQPGALKQLSVSGELPPAYAQRCSLNAAPAGGAEWEERATKLFLELLGDTEQPMPACFIHRGATCYVDLSPAGGSVVAALVAAGLASPARGEDGATCFASHVTSPSEFWLQLESSAAQLESVAEQLSLASTWPPLPADEAQEGAPCAARFPEDGLWYRAQVVTRGSDGTEVLFLDYGNASLADELKVLPEALKNLPALSRKCCLQKPPGISEWSEPAEVEFAELAADGATVFGVTFLAEGDISVVELLLEGESVTDRLAALCAPPVPEAPSAPPAGRITYCVSPEDFWIRRTAPDSELQLLAQVPARALIAAEIPSEKCIEGAFCLSLFPEDNLWYRSLILDHGNAGTEVLHLDYGDTSVVQSIKQMPEDLQDIAPLALHCTLKDSPNNSKSHEIFSELSSDPNNLFTVEMLDANVEPCVVNLFFNNTDVCALLSQSVPAPTAGAPQPSKLAESSQAAEEQRIDNPLTHSNNKDSALDVEHSTQLNTEGDQTPHCTDSNKITTERAEETESNSASEPIDTDDKTISGLDNESDMAGGIENKSNNDNVTSNLEAEIDAANKLDNETSDLESEINAANQLDSETSDLEAEIDAANKLDNETSDLEAEIDAANKLDNETSDLEAEINAANQLDSETSDLEAEIDAANKLDNETSDLEAEIDAANKLDNETSDLEAEIDAGNKLDHETSDLEAEIDAANKLDNETSDLEAEIDAAYKLDNETSDLEAEIDAGNKLDHETSDLEAEIDAANKLDNETSDLEAEIDAGHKLDHETSDLEAEIDAANKLDNETSDLEAEIDTPIKPDNETSDLGIETNTPNEASNLGIESNTASVLDNEPSDLETEIDIANKPEDETSDLEAEIDAANKLDNETSDLEAEIDAGHKLDHETSDLEAEIDAANKLDNETSDLEAEIDTPIKPDNETSDLGIETNTPNEASNLGIESNTASVLDNEPSDLETKGDTANKPEDETSDLETKGVTANKPKDGTSDLETKGDTANKPEDETSDLRTETNAAGVLHNESSDLVTGPNSNGLDNETRNSGNETNTPNELNDKTGNLETESNIANKLDNETNSAQANKILNSAVDTLKVDKDSDDEEGPGGAVAKAGDEKKTADVGAVGGDSPKQP